MVMQRILPSQSPGPATRGERGAALLVVTFVLVIVLVGGIATIAMTTGELASSRGHRVQALTDACAVAATEQIRAQLTNPAVTVANSMGTMSTGFTYQAGHYTGTPAATDPAYITLNQQNYDSSSLQDGERAGNTLGNSSAMKVIGITAICKSPGGAQREMQLIVRYGVPST